MSTPNPDLYQRAQSVLFQNYRTQPIALVRGEGTKVWDADGKQYLDFIGGIATVSVGHANVLNSPVRITNPASGGWSRRYRRPSYIDPRM